MKIKEFTQEHKYIFKKLGVAVVYLFGSQAKGITNPFSDADFGIVLLDVKKYHKDPMRVYRELYGIFLRVLPKSYLRQRLKMRAHEFDIVFLQDSSLRMQYKAAEEGVILYQSDLAAVFDFRERALSSYFDFKYFEHIQNQAFLITSSKP